MPSWNSRGLRGSMLEEALNMTNEQYRKEHLALVQKIPTPITPINIDKEHRHITLAYFEQKSTVDYIGNVQGVPICFDAKECAGERFALQNIHEHQMEYMQDFERQDGIAFLIVYFKEAGAYYICTVSRCKTLLGSCSRRGTQKAFCVTNWIRITRYAHQTKYSFIIWML